MKRQVTRIDHEPKARANKDSITKTRDKSTNSLARRSLERLVSLPRIARLSAGVVLIGAITFGSLTVVHAFTGSPVKYYDKTLAQAGYTLIAPNNNKDVFLVNNNGKVIHAWYPNNYAGAVTKLLPNGELLRTYQTAAANKAFPMGGVGGGIELLDWNSNVKWNYTYDTPNAAQHHDATVLPNGDVMFIAWVKKTEAEAIAAGVNPANLDPKTHTTWSDSIVEVSPTTNQVVWQWNAWDHLIQDYNSNAPNYGNPADYPGRINANYYAYSSSEKPDWLHPNSIDFNPTTNQVMMSVREFNEVWVIDHSTTTAQAATSHGGNSGQGGDLIYRFGNPAAYGHGTESDRTLYLQHDANWIQPGLSGAGDVLVFNDGDTVTGSRDYSSVLELQLPQTGYTYAKTSDGTFASPTTVWTYAPTGKQAFFSNIMGSAQRLPNGDTLIGDATHGRAIEVSSNDKVDWVYKSPAYDINQLDKSGPKTNNIFRAYKYAPSYSAFNGKNLQD